MFPLQTLDDEPAATGKEYQWQNRPVSDWTNQQVCHWLMGMNMDQYTPEFTAKGVDGQQLLHLDSDKLKVKHKIQIQHLQMSQCCRLIKVCYRKKSSVRSACDCHLVARFRFHISNGCGVKVVFIRLNICLISLLHLHFI